MQVETFKKNVTGYNTNLTHISWKNLQDIIGKISDELDPVSTSLKAVISKLKKRNHKRVQKRTN